MRRSTALTRILATIALESPKTAERVLGVFDATAESLSDLANRGRIVPELEQSTIREVFVYRYRLLYQVLARAVDDGSGGDFARGA